MAWHFHNMFRCLFNVKKLKMLIYKALLFVSTSFVVVGQLFLKKGMTKVGKVHLRLNNTLLPTLVKMFTNPFVILGVLFFGGSTLLWMIILSNLDLSYVYPIVSIGYVMVALTSKIFLKENISLTRWMSIAIICTGVFFVTIS